MGLSLCQSGTKDLCLWWKFMDTELPWWTICNGKPLGKTSLTWSQLVLWENCVANRLRSSSPIQLPFPTVGCTIRSVAEPSFPATYSLRKQTNKYYTTIHFGKWTRATADQSRALVSLGEGLGGSQRKLIESDWNHYLKSAVPSFSPSVGFHFLRAEFKILLYDSYLNLPKHSVISAKYIYFNVIILTLKAIWPRCL